jgi:hypothetical protein
MILIKFMFMFKFLITMEHFTIYDIATQIKVIPDFTNFESIKDKLISADPFFSTNIILNQGSYLNSIQIIQKLASLLNEQSYSDKLGLILNNNISSIIAFPQIFWTHGKL